MKRSWIYRFQNFCINLWQDDHASELLRLGFSPNGAARMLACAMKEMRVWHPKR
jgi:hypothetical protein